MHPSILPPWCLLQPTNHGTRFAVCWPTKNEPVRKWPTLLANIKCWPTFWTHDRHLFTNTVGRHMLANICLSCVRGLHTTNKCWPTNVVQHLLANICWQTFVSNDKQMLANKCWTTSRRWPTQQTTTTLLQQWFVWLLVSENVGARNLFGSSHG